MAKLKYGAIITDSRGSIGGSTIKWSRYGHVLYNKPLPAKKLTERNSVVRATFLTLTKRWWSALDSTQRDDWRALAAANPRPNVWGDEFALTGLALYVGLNLTLARANLTLTDDAPVDLTVTSPSTATLTITAPSTATLAFTPTPVPADHIAYIAASYALSPGVTNVDQKLFFLTASGTGATSPLTLSTPWLTRVGAFAAGRQYFASLRFLNTTNASLSGPVLTSDVAS